MNEKNSITAAQFRGRMLQWTEDHEKRMDEKFETVHNDTLKIETTIKEHINYHKKNEHKWGIYTYLKKRPFVTLLIGAIMAGILIESGYNVFEIIKKKFGIN